MRPSRILFLHGGPGLSAIAERELYGDSLQVDWWDQPRCDVLFARPYDALLDDVAYQAERLADLGTGKVDLLAHSFGARLALYLAMFMPERIGAVTLVAPVFDVAAAYLRLGQRVATVGPGNSRLLQALARFDANRDNFNDFWNLVEAICEVPRFFDIYWGPNAEDQRRWFHTTIATQPWADLNTCKVVLQDFWTRPDLAVQTTVTGPVELIFGSHDLLVDPSEEVRRWLNYFPHATTRRVNAGHLVHLETPPSQWMTPIA